MNPLEIARLLNAASDGAKISFGSAPTFPNMAQGLTGHPDTIKEYEENRRKLAAAQQTTSNDTAQSPSKGLQQSTSEAIQAAQPATAASTRKGAKKNVRKVGKTAKA